MYSCIYTQKHTDTRVREHTCTQVPIHLHTHINIHIFMGRFIKLQYVTVSINVPHLSVRGEHRSHKISREINITLPVYIHIYIHIYIYIYIYIYIERERERYSPTPVGLSSLANEVILLPLAFIASLFIYELRSW